MIWWRLELSAIAMYTQVIELVVLEQAEQKV
jgi:hypothetical protein